MDFGPISKPIYKGIRIVNRPDPENVGRMDRAILPMTCTMMDTGMRVSVPKLQALSTRLDTEMGELAEQVYDLAGQRFNIRSGDQLASVLFHKLHIKGSSKVKYTKGGDRESVESDVLEELRFKHPIIPPIIDWNQRKTLKSVFVTKLMGILDSNSRVHTEILTTRTDTGRLASKNPNLQNIPIRTELGREIRKAFTPTPVGAYIGNYRVTQQHYIGSIDLSQIEMRVSAHDAGCQRMIDIYLAEGDLYWDAAEQIFHRTFSPDERKHGMVGTLDFKSVYRFPAKTFTLMINYDATAPGVLKQIVVTLCDTFRKQPDVAKEQIARWNVDNVQKGLDDWYRGYPEILGRRHEHHRRARRYKYVWEMWGGVRYIPQVQSSLEYVVQEGLRQAGNLAGQGGAAGVIKLGMARAYDEWEAKWKRYGIWPLMQIHDELVWEGPKEPLTDFLYWQRKMFRKQVPLSLPIEAEVAVSEESWGHCK